MAYRKRGHLHKVCGCPRQRWVRCVHPWHFAFQYQKRPYRFSLSREAGKPAGYAMTKGEAQELADTYRHQIRTGTFRQLPHDQAKDGQTPDTRLTFGDVANAYLKEYVPFNQRYGGLRREAGRRLMEWYVKALKRATLPGPRGTTIPLIIKPIAEITTADVEAVRSGWPLRTTGSRGGQTGPNRALKRLHHLFNWAIGRGYLETSPFRRGDTVVVHIPRDRERHRRLEAGEDERLLAHASDSDPWLYALIIVLLETGCRVGEILALTWADVKWRENVLLIEGDIAKNEEPRDVPMTELVRALLEMRRHAPDGSEFPSAAFVFGDAIGKRVRSARDPWEKLCAAVAITDLHVHDLRREFACRLRESGAPDHEVAALLGHANISTTSIYLKTNRVTLQKAAKRFDRQRTLCKAIVKSLPIALKTSTRSKGHMSAKAFD